ncbi:hypothetical protein LZL87_011454 [Fusarium oxysporum]|nr:hypothetical protein LZL87_011454 [Fusarium oxysporum]
MYFTTFCYALLATAFIPFTECRVVVEIHDVRISETEASKDESNLISQLTRDYTQQPICLSTYANCKRCCTCYYNEYGAMNGQSCKCPGPKKQDLDFIETDIESDQIPLEEPERISYDTPEDDVSIQGLLDCSNFEKGGFKDANSARAFCISRCYCAKAKTGKGWETHCTKGTDAENKKCHSACIMKTCP